LVIVGHPLRGHPRGTTMQAVNERSSGPQNASKSPDIEPRDLQC
jgi:hypothetical protein